jgi:hypothetical protein
MKNETDPALLQPSNISNEIKKRVPKSCETIPLNIMMSKIFIDKMQPKMLF